MLFEGCTVQRRREIHTSCNSHKKRLDLFTELASEALLTCLRNDKQECLSALCRACLSETKLHYAIISYTH